MAERESLRTEAPMSAKRARAACAQRCPFVLWFRTLNARRARRIYLRVARWQRKISSKAARIKSER